MPYAGNVDRGSRAIDDHGRPPIRPESPLWSRLAQNCFGRSDGTCPGTVPGHGPSPRPRLETLQRAALAATLAPWPTTIESLIDELERSYTEVQERLSDPAVYNDHREAADVGRRLKELEPPYKLAQEWRAMREDVDGVAGRPGAAASSSPSRRRASPSSRRS